MSGGVSAEEIYERIYTAILEQRLTPGTKLSEEKLGAIFAVGRGHVRQALARLEHERIVELIPNRGAFVTRPTAKQSDDVLDARRLIEPALARRLALRAGPAEVGRLAGHVEAEYQAQRAADARTAIWLSGAFHNLLAELAGNDALAHVIRELSALTCLVILVHHAPTASACRPHEHGEIVAAVGNHDGDRAAAAIVAHLDQVRAALTFAGPAPVADLSTVFG
jgi:DNA-binding GntR family transcriptional regulator